MKSLLRRCFPLAVLGGKPLQQALFPKCPPNKPPVQCLVDPCTVNSCPAHPEATCVADYCGGCNARFFDRSGNEVTDSCACPVKGQIFTTCGSACPPNCTTPNPRFCILICIARCQCPSGQVIDETINTCVPVEKCPKRDPCAAVDCPVGTECKVFEPTGEPFCQPSCRINNGGCPRRTKCELVPVFCIRAPCPPVVKCRQIGHGCPPGVPLVECLVDPCRSATCPAHPHAVCVADYCGGCNAKFFDRDGKEVTSSCNLKAY
ncbi:hypothetical protein EMCRGX_G005719 [Ephydatia muelleri]